MIIESIGITASPQKCEELGRALRSLLGPMRVEQGCIDCRLSRDMAEPSAFHLESRWRTKDDLMRHARSERYKRLLLLMEMGAAPPSIEFHDVSTTLGLEFIQAVRGAALARHVEF